MKVYFDPLFYQEYSSDPAAESGRMEAIVQAIENYVEFADCFPSSEEELLAAHTRDHLEQVRRIGLYEIAALAAGGAMGAAKTGMDEPSFALISPPGHHASADSCWGFCYFNNMAVSLYHLKRSNLVDRAFVLDFDLHYGDGNVNILGNEPWVEILNPQSRTRDAYLNEVERALTGTGADVIAVSAGFDHHINDWGGLLYTEDYQAMGSMVRAAARRNSGGCYGILEGGYNHKVLGANVRAFITGLGGT
jgi:acetoin utilization deacetylase AcuC-like enzyme